jgi:indole-3-glycerol phosphate synthase
MILEKIKKHKLETVTLKKSQFSTKILETSPLFDNTCFSMKNEILNSQKSGIIAEFKRKSPSKGNINLDADVEEVTTGYLKVGAAALSVLTDEEFFGAARNDFEIARKINQSPILRKDFIVDEYQIIETKAMGADVILLIAKMLSKEEINAFSMLAKSIGLEVFLEFHNEQEIMNNTFENIDLVGINNRNLNSFEVDIENSIRLASLLPNHVIRIAESGIEKAETIQLFKREGFNGFLIGEYFMRSENPVKTCEELINQIRYAL